MKRLVEIVRDTDGVVHLTILFQKDGEKPKKIRSEPFWGTIQDCIRWCNNNFYEVHKVEDNL